MAEDAQLLKSEGKRWPDEDQLPSEECLPILAAIKDAITINEALPVGQFCSHPTAVFHIPTGSKAPIFCCQYPIPHSLHPAVQSQVQQWLDMGVIERSSPSNPWNMPILAAPKKDANGIKTYDKP